MANLFARTIQSIRDGTTGQKLAVRRGMLRQFIWQRTEFLLWYMGYAPWQCRFKRWYLCRFGAVIGEGLYMERCVTIRQPEKLKIGKHSGIGVFSVVTCGGGMTIGDYVMIGYGARVLSANHRVLPAGQYFRYSGHVAEPIRLENGCWLGTNVIVLPGVTVGEGAVVAAGAVVTHDVPPNAYVAGVPAKVISYREGADPGPGH